MLKSRYLGRTFEVVYNTLAEVVLNTKAIFFIDIYLYRVRE